MGSQQNTEIALLYSVFTYICDVNKFSAASLTINLSFRSGGLMFVNFKACHTHIQHRANRKK